MTSTEGTTVADIAERVGGAVRGDPATAVTTATHDSRSVGPGTLYCCVVGAINDGHGFARQAVARGASALLCERPLAIDVPQVVVPDTRAAMGPAASLVHGDPSTSMDIIGVTGTNGKTTVVTILSQLLAAVGRSCEVIGTLTGSRTTPEATDLQEQLAAALRGAADSVAIEVSSHALDMRRVDGTRFRIAVFTNLGSDHLDYHETPERYFAAKARLFGADLTAQALVNLDDVHGLLLRDTADVPVVGYSLESLGEISIGPSGSSFVWRGHQVSTPLIGRFNVSNCLAAAEAALLLGCDSAQVASALSTVRAPVGRLEVVDEGQEFVVVVDYAHTPDALENVLDSTAELLGESGRLTVVFGCGGDRDRKKRSEMGAVASRLAQRVIITDDNPRTEDPDAIVSAVLAGASRAEVERNRGVAIQNAIAGARSGDVVVIAGKGHEQVQVVGEVEHPFSDQRVARAAILAGGSAA